MKNDEYILSCENLSKSYKMGAVNLEVLKDLDFNVSQGEFLAIVGSSGSGKSTLLHLLGALDKSDTGSVYYRGKSLTKMSSGKINNFRNKKVGFVFQFYHLLDELTLLENVLLPQMVASSIFAWPSRRKNATQKANELMAQLSIADRSTHRPFQLSGGQRQRAAIARALINSPEILLADEPTGNLDSETGKEILNVFKDLHDKGQTIIMVTHDENVAKLADRTIRLFDGKFA